MEITEVRVFTVREDKLKAFVSIVIDDCFMVNDIKVIQGSESRFISMPSRRKRNGEFKDVAHPLDNDTRSELESRILAEYDRVIEEGGEELADSEAPAPAPARRRRRRRRRSGRRPVEKTTSAAGASDAPAGGPAGSDAAVDTVPPVEPSTPVEEKAGESLEEVAEKHLSDSFWTT
jgi:stage V sporulation protein G